MSRRNNFGKLWLEAPSERRKPQMGFSGPRLAQGEEENQTAGPKEEQDGRFPLPPRNPGLPGSRPKRSLSLVSTDRPFSHLG
jgi:hypothetical protein